MPTQTESRPRPDLTGLQRRVPPEDTSYRTWLNSQALRDRLAQLPIIEEDEDVDSYRLSA